MISIDWQRIEHLLGHQGKLWLALSGGVDSVVLLHCLVNQAPNCLRSKLSAIHVHHGLSDYADTWLNHCQTLCEDMSVPFCFEKVEVNQSGSIEEQARQERYQVFEKHLNAGDVLLQGHHANDQVETLLFRLERGCGWRGVQGIPESRKLGVATIYRPLLSITRTQIEAYAEQYGLAWVEDDSNSDVRFRRNFLRHHVIAPWQNDNPNIAKQVSQSVERLQSEGRVLERLTNEALQSYITPEGGLLLSTLPESERGFWLMTYLSKHGISITQQQQVALEKMFYSHKENQPEFYGRFYQLVRFKDVMYILPPVATVKEQLLSARTWLEREFDAVYCDRDVELKGRPESLALKLKNGKTRPLKKWLQDQSVPKWWREQLPYVFEKGELVAIGDLWQHPEWQGELTWQRNDKLVWPKA